MKDKKEEFTYTIAGVLFAVLIGLITWIIANDPISSLMISLLSTILALHIESRYLSLSRDSRIVDLLALKISLVEDTALSSQLKNITENYLELKKTSHRVFIRKAEQHLTESVNYIHDLRNGHMRIDTNEFVLVASDLILNVNKTLFATSLVKMEEFWLRGFSDKYLKEHKKALERGVKITRVFIIEAPDALSNEELRILINKQLQLSIDVRIIWHDRLPTEYLQDFGIWDDELVFYVRFSPNFQTIGADIYTDSTSIRKAHEVRDFMLQESEYASSVITD